MITAVYLLVKKSQIRDLMRGAERVERSLFWFLLGCLPGVKSNLARATSLRQQAYSIYLQAEKTGRELLILDTWIGEFLKSMGTSR